MTIKKISLIFGVFIFIFTTAFTVNKVIVANALMYADCEVCTATGCDAAEGTQTGVTDCQNKYENGELEGCKLSGRPCSPNPEIHP